MGWCHEFGVDIEERCGHPMTAGATSCSCSECGTVCHGRFDGGCYAVWSRGPRSNAPGRPPRASLVNLPVVGGNGSSYGDPQTAEARAAQPHDTKVNGAGVGDDGARRVKELQAALARLAGEVAHQAKYLAALEEHMDAMDKVVGQLGMEVDARLGRLEERPSPRAHPPRRFE